MRTKIKELENKIKEAASAYYNTSSPIISDEEFDLLVSQLNSIDPSNKLLKTVGWGCTLPTHKQKFPHLFHVTGIDNKIQYNETSYKEYLNPDEWYIQSSKLDGISGVAYYIQDENDRDYNILERVLTRHDGEIGLDVTSNLIYCNIPKRVPSNVKWVRGEIVTTWDAIGDRYTHPRNMAAGLANSDELTEDHKNLSFVVYNCNKLSVDDNLPKRMEFLETLGFEIDKYVIHKPSHENNIIRIFNYSLPDYSGYKYPVDGSVLVNISNEEEVLVFKYPTPKVRVKVVKVVNQISARGRVIPVIEIEPTVLSGCTITYCSGFNYEKIVQHKVVPGSIITISRANEVIPDWDYDAGVDNSGVEDLDNCELFPSDIEFEGKIYSTKWKGVHLEIELNKEKDCIINLISRRLPHGIGHSKINDLLKSFPISSIVELSTFINLVNNEPEKVKEIIDTDFSDSFRDRMNELAISISKGYTVAELLESTFSRNLGYEASYRLMKLFENNADKLYNHLVENQGLSKEISNNMPSYVVAEGVKENLVLILDVLNLMPVKEFNEKAIDSSNKIKICLTGKLSKPRGDLINEWSDKVIETDVNNCDYLITDNPSSGSSKNKAAEKLGKQVISEEAFRKIIGI